MRSGFIAIVGRPNVGKSTLLNAILGEKIAITSDKPQTTRNTIRGIYSDEDTQVIFIDTPGIHRPRTKMGEFMTESALGTFNEVDGIIFIVDSELSQSGGDRYITDLLAKIQKPKLLLVNKIDAIEPERFQRIYESYAKGDTFDKILGVSALKGVNIEQVIGEAKSYMPQGPAYFPKDMVTDHPERFIVAEIIREKTLHYLQDEVPHGVAVEIESFEESEGDWDGPAAVNQPMPRGLTKISAVLYCEKKSHKGMIIGKQGKKLKGIGKSARLEIENLLGTKVFLQLWVKIKENWRDSTAALSSFGYK